MKWVKASERLPEIIMVNIKHRGNPSVIYHHKGVWAFDDYEDMIVLPEEWEFIEWLDESSPSDNTQSIDTELAGKIWDAAELHKSQLLLSAYPPPSPDKETFINSLNLDNTQIRDGWVRMEDMEKEYKRGFDDGVKYRDGQHKAYFTIES